MKQDGEGTRRWAAEDRVYVLRVRSGREAELLQEGNWHVSVRDGATGVRRLFWRIDDCIEHLYGELVRR
ncbi:MAG: hypothetical protein JWQ08_1266 [Deinococcus sp.]|nr:hypothetical protein [Deinococcus sp.]